MHFILIHGAFSDGSSWRHVIDRLQRQGHTATAVQLGLASLADDIAITRRAITRAGQPVVLAGHSYGGAVVSGAGAGQDAVQAVAFVAGIALDAGESAAQLGERFPATPGPQSLSADAEGFATLPADRFVEFFAQGAPEEDARTLAAVQGPINGACFGTPIEAAAWREVPSLYVRALRDQMIHPEQQSAMAQRNGGQSVELDAPHAVHLTHPGEVADALVALAETVKRA